MKIQKKDKRSNFEKEIDSVLEDLKTLDVTSEAYQQAVRNLETLCKAKSYEKDNKLDKNTILGVFGNLAGILAVLEYERINVITTKALGFIMKPKF